MLTVIRTDASAAVGLGHLRRCLSLAIALRQLGTDVRFALRASDVDAATLVANEHFVVHILADCGTADAVVTDADADALCSLWSNQQVDAVVVDHYGINAAWHIHVRERLNCAVVVIDDLASRPLSPDLLIDHNFVPGPGHRARYADCLQRQPDVWLCGPRYALLGPTYAALPLFDVRDAAQSIGIFLGGTDPAGLSALTLRACRLHAAFQGPIEVVSTGGNPALAELGAAVGQDPMASLSVDLSDLTAFYGHHDLQVGAGGGATWERCCVGVPSLTLCVADNQYAVIPALASLGALVSVPDNRPETIGLAVRALLDSRFQRQELSRTSQGLVDGRGAERVALAIARRTGCGLRLRPALIGDGRTLWQWRNDPRTRKVSRQTNAIPWEAHSAWLALTLADPSRRLSVALIGDQPVGVIRFDLLRDDRHEVSLFLDPDLHGLGLGSAILSAGEQALLESQGGVTVQAEVLPDNPASLHLFLSAGYRREAKLSFAKTLDHPIDMPVNTPLSLQEPFQ